MGAEELIDLLQARSAAGAGPGLATDVGRRPCTSPADRLFDLPTRDGVAAADELVRAARRCLDRGARRPEQRLGDRVAGSQQRRELARSGDVAEQVRGDEALAVED